MINFPIGLSGQVLVLTDEVIEHFRRHRQFNQSQLEAGGQLFARFEGQQVIVEEATGPRQTDKRTHTSYEPDRAAEQAEILARYASGLHFVGDWHTHPSTGPVPSGRDVASMAECVSKSTHGLNAFFLVIVGRSDPPDGLHVSVHDGSTNYRLGPSES